MLKFRVCVAFCLLLSLANCKQVERDGTISFAHVNGDKVTVCDLSKTSSQEVLLLSELVEELEIIHLEDIDEAFFKAWVITVTDNYIGIRQSGAPFKLFDRKGHFLHDIGKVGNGPGEYSISLYDEIIDEKNNRIYFSSFMGDKIMVYGMDGSHIEDIQLPFRMQKPKIELTDEGNLTVVHMPFPDDEYFAFQMDMQGNILKKVAPRDDIRVFSFDSELFSYRNGTDFDVYHTALDTLYHLDTNSLELVPVLTSAGREDDWLCVYNELPHRYLLNVFNWKTRENKMISTKKGAETSSQVKLMNDYLGNLEMDFSFNKGYFIQNIEPGALMEKIEKHLANSSLDNEGKEKLNALLGTLHEDQNNVLMVGRMKK
ncbi:6-bladed beta-propeller [Bacteroides sp. OttesenSCG-928-E20]|nr:6-bladed beta-propeller [Bacteroides sp. OttesenSCG-928-N06]MDL2299652.1 6-bladed beta-propeller [Bacteroides sp. OttesenSCG-928-E20]MDL2304244.1 6-bladed beta-propeller [Bacteroides sp. OttesenSCG-928-D19]